MIEHRDVPSAQLAFTVDETLIALFFLPLQQGVKIRRRVGCSIDAFLRSELGAGPETIEKIQSIMLDGRPVDDIGSAFIHSGSALALSAAMPGLVGATLRRGGTYASFRSGITYCEAEKAGAPGEGWVTIKLFNLLMAELGPGLLRAGVFLKTTVLLHFLTERACEITAGGSAALNGRAIDVGKLTEGATLGGRDEVFLTVNGGLRNGAGR